MKKYRFFVDTPDGKWEAKGCYYQKNHIIIVGDVVKDHTVRLKYKVSEVKVDII